MTRRLPAIAVVCLALLGLSRVDDPHPFDSTSAAARADATVDQLGSSVDETAATSTWYCPAAGAGTATAPTHQIVITNSGPATTARVTGFRSASNDTKAIEVRLKKASQTVVVANNIDSDVLGVSVEIVGSGGSVAHRLVSPNASDQSDCLTRASTEWHFPSATTETGSTSRLWLLNPFPTDASVDVSVVTEDGVRVPKALRGLIIPAGSSRVVDIGEAGQKRAQFALSVRSRGGRVLAELAQTSSPTKSNGGGLRVQPGIGSAERSWVFADSFGGANVTDQLVIYNPDTTDASVAVSVFPEGSSDETLPEPFVIEVPARRFTSLQLDKESRVPPDSRRWIQVESLEQSGTTPGVVAVEVIGIVGPGGDGTVETRPAVAGGLASSTGIPVAASRWTVSSVDTTVAKGQSAVVVVNPSTDTIALVTISKVGDGVQSAVSEKPIEVPPRGVLPVDVTAAGKGSTASLIISSPTPVIVAARTTSNEAKDLAMWPGLPSVRGVSALPSQVGR